MSSGEKVCASARPREGRRDRHALPRAPHIGEIIARALAGAAAVLAPFVTRQPLVRKQSLGMGEREPRRRDGAVAIARKAALILRPEPMHDEALAGARARIAAGGGRAVGLAEARRPGEAENVKVELPRPFRDRARQRRRPAHRARVAGSAETRSRREREEERDDGAGCGRFRNIRRSESALGQDAN